MADTWKVRGVSNDDLSRDAAYRNEVAARIRLVEQRAEAAERRLHGLLRVAESTPDKMVSAGTIRSFIASHEAERG